MTEIEDADYLERRLRTSISVVLRTEASRPLAAYAKAKDPVDRDRALREITERLTISLSRQYEIGQVDPGSHFYISNYAAPRDPIDRAPRKRSTPEK